MHFATQMKRRGRGVISLCTSGDTTSTCPIAYMARLDSRAWTFLLGIVIRSGLMVNVRRDTQGVLHKSVPTLYNLQLPVTHTHYYTFASDLIKIPIRYILFFSYPWTATVISYVSLCTRKAHSFTSLNTCDIASLKNINGNLRFRTWFINYDVPGV